MLQLQGTPSSPWQLHKEDSSGGIHPTPCRETSARVHRISKCLQNSMQQKPHSHNNHWKQGKNLDLVFYRTHLIKISAASNYQHFLPNLMLLSPILINVAMILIKHLKFWEIHKTSNFSTLTTKFHNYQQRERKGQTCLWSKNEQTIQMIALQRDRLMQQQIKSQRQGEWWQSAWVAGTLMNLQIKVQLDFQIIWLMILHRMIHLNDIKSS